MLTTATVHHPALELRRAQRRPRGEVHDPLDAAWRVLSQHAPAEGWSELEGGESTITAFTSDMELFDADKISIICCDRRHTNINMEWLTRDGWGDAEVSWRRHIP